MIPQGSRHPGDNVIMEIATRRSTRPSTTAWSTRDPRRTPGTARGHPVVDAHRGRRPPTGRIYVVDLWESPEAFGGVRRRTRSSPRRRRGWRSRRASTRCTTSSGAARPSRPELARRCLVRGTGAPAVRARAARGGRASRRPPRGSSRRARGRRPSSRAAAPRVPLPAKKSRHQSPSREEAWTIRRRTPSGFWVG